MAKFAVRCAIVFCALYSSARAESKLTLPGCDVTPALRTEIKQKLDYKKLDRMPFAERVEYRRSILNDLAKRYPREFAPEQRLIQDTANDEPDQLPELRRRFREAAAQHPDDPLAQTILARSLISQDTPAAIALLDQLRNIPQFPAPSLILAGVYADGKRVDKRKATEYLSDYIKHCPATTDQDAQWLLGKLGTPEMQATVATALRERLARETDPEVLRSYETLWGLEFRVHPPQEHDALRKQVARDLRRLETANPKPDSAWAGMLLSGLKQSGASPAEVAAAEDKLSHDYPASSEASRIASDRWRKQHKEPENQKDLEAWKTYSAEYRTQQLLWRSTFTEVDYLRPSTFYAAINDPGLTESEAVKLMEDYLQWGETYKAPGSGTYDTAASVLLDHHWQSARALELMQKAMIQDQLEQARQARDDNRAETSLWSQSELREHLSLLGDFLRAALAANRPDVVSPYRAEIEAKPAGDVLGAEYRWRANQARLALLNGHKADALAFYQQALRTRPSPAEYWHGRLDDPLTEDAHALWTGMGGSEVAWALWSAAPPTDTKLAQGVWQTPAKSLPTFELADLAGKTWRLKNLEGKTVLVNVWATWCGPCQAELPKLQELYKQTKDRPDVQILTFNIDTDLGLVQPFVREKGFTFPVLPAYALVNSVVDDIAIPQNWILDAKGTWRLTQLGYGAEDDWGGAMLKKMETVR